MALNTLKDLLIDELSELYHGERRSLSSMSILARAAASPRLSAALRSHAAKTGEHVSRLERVFEELAASPRLAGAKGLNGLLDDCTRTAAASDADPHVRDAALIAMAQHVEHDEIAGYGCAKTWAGLLGYNDAAATLQKTLLEEKQADAELTTLAEVLNRAALQPALT